MRVRGSGPRQGKPPLIARGSGERAEIALSFDDGPGRWTAEIAATLEEHGCNATFFLRGRAVEERPDLVRPPYFGISSDKRDTDSREPTAEAVRRLVPALLKRGLRPVTVSKLLA